MEKHENGENNTAASMFLEVIVLKLFLPKCPRKLTPIELRKFQSESKEWKLRKSNRVVLF